MSIPLYENVLLALHIFSVLPILALTPLGWELGLQVAICRAYEALSHEKSHCVQGFKCCFVISVAEGVVGLCLKDGKERFVIEAV